MKKSAGLLLFKRKPTLQVLLVHPGGPFWKNKDVGAWTIPKGEIEEKEDPLQTAIREFREETGAEISGAFIPLTLVKQKGGKIIYAWAVETNLVLDQINSITFEMEWPPHSGKMQIFPEIDKANWFSPDDAKEKINPAQIMLLDELEEKIKKDFS